MYRHKNINLLRIAFYSLIFAVFSYGGEVFMPNVFAQTTPKTHVHNKTHVHKKSKIKRIVREVPGPNERLTQNLIRVSANKTPSGFPVPRFVSLKYSKSYGRSGPSKQNKVLWTYKRRGLPMIVVAETEMWRKVRDIAGEESWMHKSLLSGKKMVLTRTDITLRSKPKSDAKARAIAAKGALLQVENCEDNWCKLKDQNDEISGYARKSLLWGVGDL